MRVMNLLWALAFACVAVSCSDDLENGSGDKGIDEKDGPKAYLTVTISTVSDVMGAGAFKAGLTKAGEEPSNPNSNGAGWGEDGNGWLGELAGKNEGKVYDINIFLVSTEKRSLSSSDQLENINLENANSISFDAHGYKDQLDLDASDGGIEPNHGSATVTITMKDDLGKDEKRFLVYTIVNAGTNLSSIKTLGNLRDYLQAGGDNSVIKLNEKNVETADKFVMSTHKMYSENQGNPSIVALSNANTVDNPANTSVYVERLAARIDLSYPEGGTLPNDNDKSPVHGKGTFKLTGYMVVNQWNGKTKMFKQVTPEVSDYTKDIDEHTLYGSNPPRYLGDEIWEWTPPKGPGGTYNFVWSEDFYNKQGTDFETKPNKWNSKDYYDNYFSDGLNNREKINEIPKSGISYEDTKTFYPIAYVRENTMNTSEQLNGFSTGVIFRTKFTPGDNFVMTQYENGAIKADVKLTNKENFEFLTAEHFNGKEVVKMVYADVKSVAARAFNISNGDTKDILKGFMEGWDNAERATDVTLQALQDTINKMSDMNTLSKLFKQYLTGVLDVARSSGTDLGTTMVTEWIKQSDNKGKLTYDGFVNSQRQDHKTLLTKTPLSSYEPTDIENLAEWYGIYFFRDGQSYHKYWIRHDNNNDPNVMGVMEFAIVRNNVYQLDVTGVRGLGDPLPFTPGKDDPGTPDESNEISINVTVFVKDWVKRKNDEIIL